MNETGLLIRRLGDGLRGITPHGAATVLDASPRLDVMVLEVAGGHLTWNVLAGPSIPAAVIDDVELAQEWVWAIYGEHIALALDAVRPGAPPTPSGPDGRRAEFTSAPDGDRKSRADVTTAPGVDGERNEAAATPHIDAAWQAAAAPDIDAKGYGVAAPALPGLAVSAWRLAYAHWASRWWPASTVDGIAALDQRLLDQDIAVLTEECESLLDGVDAVAPAVDAMIESRPRASDYALAAGDEVAGGLVLGRGVGGWDWRCCPPGLIDASEQAVSWRVIRDNGDSTIAVSAVTAPGLPAELPAYLRPWARIATGGEVRDTPLRSTGDAWIGETVFAATGSAVRVDIYLPGFGIAPNPDTVAPFGPDAGQAQAPTAADSPPRATAGAYQGEIRRSIREFARMRLQRAAVPGDLPSAGDSATADGGSASALFDDSATAAPLLAEIAAAVDDSDF
ncbi:hypothetical protein OHB26_20275 [Nocardia sp. NBC_01503]|uniref:hypothetical protein n=1 Tax=Nocardia sp. NBC_01503 TaxID=2975997 RepID=UPI002E7B8D23|nr:hypothetical protein [Nocardia sp. NBC_01503]WTL29349.1 hypothetical protein OHB26_20275 [Nocardia sp. NBC_01503]